MTFSDLKAQVSAACPSWILAFTVLFQFALLSMLWQSSSGAGSLIWTACSAVLMLLAAIVCRADKLDSRPMSCFVGGFILIYLLSGWLSYQIIGSQSQARLDWLMEACKVMPLAAIFYAFGVVVGGRQPVRALGAAVICSALYTIVNADSYSSQALWERAKEGLNVTYQYSGDAFAISALLLLGMIRRLALRLGLMVLAVVVMFIIPSRSSAMVGVISIAVWALLYIRQKGLILAGFAVCIVVAWSLGWLSPEALEQTFSGTRFESMIAGEGDSSKESRDEIAAVGLTVIQQNFMSGYFGFQVDMLGEAGSYIHSALDIWAQSGLLPFAVFVAMWVWIAMRIMAAESPVPRHREKFLGVVLFSLLSWIFARHTHVGVLYFPLGVASACLAGYGGGVRRPLVRRRRTSVMPGIGQDLGQGGGLMGMRRP